MASGGDGRGSGGRRYRRDLQGVLQLCTEVGSIEGSAVGDSEQMTSSSHMSIDRREFLNNALDGMIVNIVDQQKKALMILQNKNVDDQSKVEALESLCELCENLDAACDFQKIGGFPVLQSMLQHSNSDVRCNSAELLATLVQNNPFCQKAATNPRLMRLLMKLLDSDSVDIVRVKALYALSCLCRDCVEAQDEFCRLDGFSHLMRAMQQPNEKLQIKSAFMLTALCTSQTKFKDTLCNMGMIEQLIALLHGEHSSFHEYLMAALVNIVEDNPRSAQACTQPELQLAKLLQERIHHISGKEEFEEEKQHAERLMYLCFSQGGVTGER